ncbi:hypothetical protein BU16DRAFT_545531 [Lophium mytilinum]|uniref:Uncharacterized protein n=1 Tax=Lophium mytilinum TaxID=390894 RepID=A0A6A6Q8C8_9PEZI|nr:hypothetical protein BU16DRAFT_545531 [Lophium mytilinum]
MRLARVSLHMNALALLSTESPLVADTAGKLRKIYFGAFAIPNTKLSKASDGIDKESPSAIFIKAERGMILSLARLQYLDFSVPMSRYPRTATHVVARHRNVLPAVSSLQEVGLSNSDRVRKTPVQLLVSWLGRCQMVRISVRSLSRTAMESIARPRNVIPAVSSLQEVGMSNSDRVRKTPSGTTVGFLAGSLARVSVCRLSRTAMQSIARSRIAISAMFVIQEAVLSTSEQLRMAPVSPALLSSQLPRILAAACCSCSRTAMQLIA